MNVKKNIITGLKLFAISYLVNCLLIFVFFTYHYDINSRSITPFRNFLLEILALKLIHLEFVVDILSLFISKSKRRLHSFLTYFLSKSIYLTLLFLLYNMLHMFRFSLSNYKVNIFWYSILSFLIVGLFYAFLKRDGNTKPIAEPQ
jgi:hypothetical protein